MRRESVVHHKSYHRVYFGSFEDISFAFTFMERTLSG